MKVCAGISQWHLDNWTDDDFRVHIKAVRLALGEAFQRLEVSEKMSYHRNFSVDDHRKSCDNVHNETRTTD